MRFRIVNGANASNFNLRLNNKDNFLQIASDGGFLEKPVSQTSIFITPGERAEIIVNFSKYSKSTRIYLMSENKYIMSFNVIEDGVDKTVAPDVLTVISKVTEFQATNVREIELDGMGHMVCIIMDLGFVICHTSVVLSFTMSLIMFMSNFRPLMDTM